MRVAGKTFAVESETIPGGWYKITVRFNGIVVDMFEKPTMEEAEREFREAGYKYIAWEDDHKIVFYKAN